MHADCLKCGEIALKSKRAKNEVLAICTYQSSIYINVGMYFASVSGKAMKRGARKNPVNGKSRQSGRKRKSTEDHRLSSFYLYKPLQSTIIRKRHLNIKQLNLKTPFFSSFLQHSIYCLPRSPWVGFGPILMSPLSMPEAHLMRSPVAMLHLQ